MHVAYQDGGWASGILDFHARDWRFVPVRPADNAQK